jgi:hypothetical protein
MVGYSGTPLAAKLGVRAGDKVLLASAPAGFTIPALPGGVTVHRRAGTGPYDVVLLYCVDRATLVERFRPLTTRIRPASPLWVCWPKRASGVPTDLTDNVVRAHGLEVGLVDVKVAAVDDVWSGIKFVYRLVDRPSRAASSSTPAKTRASRTQAKTSAS